MDILMRLILLILERAICFRLFVSSLICFFSVVQFSEYRSFTSLVRFIPGYFIFLVAISSGIFSWFLFLIFHCCTKIPLISGYWLGIPLFNQIHLLEPVFFGGVYRVFHVHYHVICKQWQFYLLFSNLHAFYFLFLCHCCG